MLATSALARFEGVFANFFREYEQYRVNSAAWDARYGARYGSSQPGFVAVHGVSGPTVATRSTEGWLIERVRGVRGRSAAAASPP